MILNIRQIPRIDFASVSPAFQGAIYNGRVIVADPVVIDGMIVDENYKPFGKSIYHRYTPGRSNPNPLVEVLETVGPYQHYHYFEDLGPALRPIWSVSQYTGSTPFRLRSWGNTVIHAPNTRKGITFTHWSILNFVQGFADSDNNLSDDLYLGSFMRLSQKLKDIPTVNIDAQNRSFYWDHGNPRSFQYDWATSMGARWEPWIPARASELSVGMTFEDACGLPQLRHLYKHSNVFTKMVPDQDLMWENLLNLDRKQLRNTSIVKNNTIGAYVLDALWATSQSPLDLFKETKMSRGGIVVVQLLKNLLHAVMKFSHGKDHFAAKFTYNASTGKLECKEKIKYVETTEWGEFTSGIDAATLKKNTDWLVLEAALSVYARDNWNVPLENIANVTLVKNYTDLLFVVNTKEGDRYIYGVPLAMAFSTIPTFSFEYDIEARKNDGKLPKDPSENKK